MVHITQLQRHSYLSKLTLLKCASLILLVNIFIHAKQPRCKNGTVLKSLNEKSCEKWQPKNSHKDVEVHNLINIFEFLFLITTLVAYNL